ncbi:hypothetical protein [Streptomyces chryseus]|uniref:hypothetical protein n=1 Tax=Streptomyces chryseus TaxID=68186 RepID=UPI001E3A90B5|nr:hypothetical protein [Streptomyces chryseus]
MAVTAGSEYTAYAYFANIVATAGRTATVTVTWYAAVTGGSAISAVTSTAATLATATSWNTPPPILIATAPPTAAYASLTITVAGLTAGAQVVADQMAIGLPNAVAGNLLPYNISGVEVDVSGWSVGANVTIDRTSSASWEGWYSLRLTSVAAGNVEARTGETAIVAGTEYVAVAMVNAPAATDLRLDLLWYDAAHALLSSVTYTRPVPAAAWKRCTLTGVAPPGAAFVRLALRPQATAAGQAWLCDQMVMRPAPLLAGTLLSYNAQSVEVDTSPWSVESGCTITHSSTRVWEGGYSMEIVATGTADAVIQGTERVPVTERQVYAVTPGVYRAEAPENTLFDTLFTWYDVDGEVIKSVYYRWGLHAVGGWFAPNSSAIAPAGATSLSVGMRWVEPQAGDVFYADNIAVTPGGLGVLADPIEGRYGTTVSLQGLTTGGYTYWGLWRMAADGTMTAIRGASGDLSKQTITGDVAIAEDYEAPLGVDVRYYLKLWTSFAYRSFTSDPIVIPEPPPTMVVLKDPGLPARQTTAMVAKGGMPAWTRSARQGVNAVRGRARPIVISDVRTSRAGVMTLITETAQELANMWWLLETGNTLLIQWPSGWGEPDAYVQVGDVTEAHVSDYAGYTDRTWSVPLTEVDRPIGGITGSAVRTWQDVSDDHVDWLSVMQSANSWLDVYTGVQGG